MALSAIMTVNLLPWREARQLRRRRVFCAGLTVSLVVVFAAVAGAVTLGRSVLLQHERDNYLLDARAALVKQRVDDQDAVFGDYQRQGVDLTRTRHLHAARTKQVRTLLLVATTPSEGLTLDRLRYTPPVVHLSGSAGSARQVSRWLAMLDGHNDILEPELQELYVDDKQPSSKRQVFLYRIRFELKTPDIGLLNSEDDF